MKNKKVLAYALSVLTIIGMCGCSKPTASVDVIEQPTSIANAETISDKIESVISDTSEEVKPEISAEETETPTEVSEDVNPSSSIENQLAMIESNFDTFYDDLNNVFYFDEYNGLIAVADLNRNGRLEFIATDCQGSGAFSYTVIYEVSEDYTTLERMKAADDFMDSCGDFSIVDSFECYKKDNKYYYVIEDYCSSGWDSKGTAFYAYNFDGEISYDLIGGYYLYGDSTQDDYLRYVNLFGSSDNNFDNDESYYASLTDYWKSFEKQPNCKISWSRFPAKESFLETLKASYEAFDVNAPEAKLSYDYKTIFGDDFNYVITLE